MAQALLSSKSCSRYVAVARPTKEHAVVKMEMKSTGGKSRYLERTSQWQNTIRMARLVQWTAVRISNGLIRAWDQYEKDFPNEKAANAEAFEQARAYLEERQNQMAMLMLRNQFLAADISWRSFPDQLGHRHSPGCFRCHNGRFSSADGQQITAQCTACHSIPVVTRRDRLHGQVLDLTDIRTPRSHQRPDFPFVHGALAAADDAGCDNCHGEIRYGKDDATFCANSGCHDSKWPNFGLQRPTALVISEP